MHQDLSQRQAPLTVCFCFDTNQKNTQWFFYIEYYFGSKHNYIETFLGNKHYHRMFSRLLTGTHWELSQNNSYFFFMTKVSLNSLKVPLSIFLCA